MDIDLNDEIVKGLTIIHNGKIVYPQNTTQAPPPQVKSQEPKKEERKE